MKIPHIPDGTPPHFTLRKFEGKKKGVKREPALNASAAPRKNVKVKLEMGHVKKSASTHNYIPSGKREIDPCTHDTAGNRVIEDDEVSCPFCSDGRIDKWTLSVSGTYRVSAGSYPQNCAVCNVIMVNGDIYFKCTTCKLDRHCPKCMKKKLRKAWRRNKMPKGPAIRGKARPLLDLHIKIRRLEATTLKALAASKQRYTAGFYKGDDANGLGKIDDENWCMQVHHELSLGLKIVADRLDKRLAEVYPI